MPGGRADTYDQRAEILGAILMRNRVVDGLRIIVPLVGVGAFVALAAQIYISNTARQYGVSGIRIDRGNIVVETPQYTGISAGGARYVVSAREASSPLDRSNEIDMTEVTLEFAQSSGATYFARSDQATVDTVTERVTAPGVVTLSGSDGLEGTLTDVVSDSENDRITSNGPVDLVMPDGTTIVAETMVREGETRTFTFTRATVIVPDLPGRDE
jgi:lipopolysaccharide export system protein LptC